MTTKIKSIKKRSIKPFYKNTKFFFGLIVLFVIISFLIIVFAINYLKHNNIEIRIIYSGEWSGTITDEDGTRTVNGSGNETFKVSGNSISVTICKNDNSHKTLTVQILENDKVISKKLTTFPNGSVTITRSF